MPLERARALLWISAVWINAMGAGAVGAWAQDAAPRSPDVAQLSQDLQQTRSELADSKREIEELRQSLNQLRAQFEAEHAATSSATPSAPSTAPEPTVAAADQDVSFLAAKVSEMHQDKVESVSKYPVKISGLILFNSYWNHGVLDIQDLPSLAFSSFPGAPAPGIGATLRQTILGLDVSGPKFLGAQTSAEAQIDFAGGNPPTSFGSATGLVRLRTARLSLDWANTSLSFGQDAPFFSPLSPTSYATVFEPAMSWSGNLWVWTPAVEVSHRFDLNESTSFLMQGGFLDPLTEEPPAFQGRDATAGEATRAPAIAGRIALDHSRQTHFPLTLGFAGYRAQQKYEDLNTVASWTLNADFKAGLDQYAELSGEWYRGQAVGGLGGGIWSSVVFPESEGPHSAIHPLRSIGGWVQLKVTPATRYEINAAFGQDENYGADLRFFPYPFTSGGFYAMRKNRTQLVNFIFKPTSALLLAFEYRHLFTLPFADPAHTGDHLNLAAGVRF